MNRRTDFTARKAAGQLHIHRPVWSQLYERRDGSLTVAFPIGPGIIHFGRATAVPASEWVFEDDDIASVVLDAPVSVSRDPLAAFSNPTLSPDQLIRMLDEDPHFARLVALTNDARSPSRASSASLTICAGRLSRPIRSSRRVW